MDGMDFLYVTGYYNLSPTARDPLLLSEGKYYERSKVSRTRSLARSRTPAKTLTDSQLSSRNTSIFPFNPSSPPATLGQRATAPQMIPRLSMRSSTTPHKTAW